MVIAIMGILAAILLANMASAAKRGRDVERQANLRNLQNAIEAYKHRNGVYPVMGCPDSSGWSNEKECPTYISGLAPAFIPNLPHDAARGNNEGYSYVVNSEQTVYKVMAMNTVEADKILYDHPFKSCDIRYGDGIATRAFPNAADNDHLDLYGWCSYYYYSSLDSHMPTQCYSNNDDVDDVKGSLRFDKSYALWGGIAKGTSKGTSLSVNPTAQIICK